ncbi:MAG: response regulator transcription factor [Chloroflexota bacterium]
MTRRDAHPWRVVVVDDHEIVRRGLVRLLDRPGFDVVAEAGTAAEALEAARRHAPDIVVMDLCLPDESGIEACRRIRAEIPRTRVVILTMYPIEAAVALASAAGASGFLLKQARGRDLVASLEAVGRGESLLDADATPLVREAVRQVASDGNEQVAALSAQERRILLLVAEGKSNGEVAAEVFLSDKTVKNYVSHILSKLGLERRTQAVGFVARHHLDEPLAVRV